MWKCNRCGASTPKTCTCPKAGDATPPATPQPETPERCQLCGGTVQAHLALDAPCRMFVGGIRRLSLSPPPDVERLKAYKRGFRDGFAAAQSWGCDMVEEALAA